MKRIVLLMLLLISFAGYAQTTINNYKYVLVPERFGFSKEPDQFGLNTQTLDFLGRKGFTAYMDNSNLPPEIAGNRCQALIAEVVQKKGMFVTNLTFLLKDCQGHTVFKGKEGKSWEKEYAVAFNQALAEAFRSLAAMPYNYTGPAGTSSGQPVAAAAPATPAPVPAAAPVAVETAAPPAEGTVLYAQATANGYQLIDTAPKIVLTLLKTSQPDMFIADGNDVHGVVLKSGGSWYFESYKNGQYTRASLQIKF